MMGCKRQYQCGVGRRRSVQSKGPKNLVQGHSWQRYDQYRSPILSSNPEVSFLKKNDEKDQSPGEGKSESCKVERMEILIS